MQTVPCHRVHHFATVMYSVELPEPQDSMEHSVNPVLDDIREEHNIKVLQYGGLLANHGLEHRDFGTGKEYKRRSRPQVRCQLDKQGADEDVGCIQLPALAENALLKSSVKLFHRYKDLVINNQAEQCAVESKIVILVEQ